MAPRRNKLVIVGLIALVLAIQTSGQPQNSDLRQFVGRYNSWWRFGGGSITLEADGTYHSDSASEAFTTQDSGTYVLSQGTLRFSISKYTGKQNGDDKEVDLFPAKSRQEFFGFSADEKEPPLKTEFVLYPIKWGDRTYLIYENDLGDFTNTINLGLEPRERGRQSRYYGKFFLREGDDEKQAIGKPSLPPKYQDWLLRDPITATIVSVQAKGEEAEAIATIDKGRIAGVRVGMKFITSQEEPTFFLWQNDGVVLSVEDTSAKMQVYHRVVGEILTTKVVRKHGSQ